MSKPPSDDQGRLNNSEDVPNYGRDIQQDNWKPTLCAVYLPVYPHLGCPYCHIWRLRRVYSLQQSYGNHTIIVHHIISNPCSRWRESPMPLLLYAIARRAGQCFCQKRCPHLEVHMAGIILLDSYVIIVLSNLRRRYRSNYKFFTCPTLWAILLLLCRNRIYSQPFSKIYFLLYCRNALS